MEEILSFYIEEFEGEMPEDKRAAYLKRAAAILDAMTNPCPALRVQHDEALRFAICAVADELYNVNRPAVLKEENGDLKLTYAKPLSAIERQAAAKVAYPYLCGTGLLYCGVRKW